MKNTTLLYPKSYTSNYSSISKMLLTVNASHVTYSVVVIEVEGVKCRALINTEHGALMFHEN